MLTRIKVYFIGFIYFLGGLFMVVFPPTNFNPGEKNPKRYHHEHDPNRSLLEYMTSEEIGQRMMQMEKEEPGFVTTYPLGSKTSQNKTAWVMEIKTDRDVKKSGVLVIGGVDPMAWASTNAVLELAEDILYEPQYHKPFLTDYDWYLIPVGNPEGHDFTLCVRDIPAFPGSVWRRNMTAPSRPPTWHKNLDGDSDEAGCFGTNVDRNFAYHWQDEAFMDQPQPCTQQYPGEHPFSTIEASNIRAYVQPLAKTIEIAIHLRAVYEHNKESIVYPWRYAARRPNKWREMQRMGEAAAREGRLPGGHLFEVHQSSEEGVHGGSLEDYLKGVVGIETVFTVRPYHESIPNSTHFKPPDDYVEQSMEIVLGLVRAHRSLSRDNTLSFFGKEKHF